MPRPKKERRIQSPPLHRRFKPAGYPAKQLKETYLELDEFEALRLADYLKMDQQEASEEMGISRPTFTRLLESAHYKMAEFLVNGHHLHIGGGSIHFNTNILSCNSCGHMFNIPIKNDMHSCPECGSDNLINYAGGFGHGPCCR